VTVTVNQNQNGLRSDRRSDRTLSERKPFWFWLDSDSHL